MTFYLPTRVYEETDCVTNHASELGALGKRALIVTGRHSAMANGSLADVEEALWKTGTSWEVFSDVEENPSVETILSARDVGVREQTDFVIGIGGGSPMDAAKAIALMIRHPDADASYLYDKSVPSDTVPVVCIPTTCGTGSEVTPVSVLTRHDIQAKGSIPHKIWPVLALCDPKYLEYASDTVLQNTACDALAHLCESYVNTNATDYSRMCVDAGLKAWCESLDVLRGEREPEITDYANMLRASTFAGMAIAHTGTSLPHGMSYSLTYDLGIAHGRACGQYLMGYLAEAPVHDRSHLLHYAGFRKLDEMANYFEDCVGYVNVPNDEREKIIQSISQNPAKLKNAPFPADETVIRRIVSYWDL